MKKDFIKDPRERAITSASTLGKNLRRSERVFLNLRVRVSAPAERGEDFLGGGQTIDVSHDDASLMVDRDLSVGQTIKVRRDIIFPTGADLDKAVLRALLRCVACGRLEVSYLNEFESDLFLNHHSVPRLCGQCGGWTTWIRPYGQVQVSAEGPDESDFPEAAKQTHTHRSHERPRTETVGCIRNSGLGNEVVLVSDLGRGGLSFFSANQYPEGTTIEMAVPYTSKAPNIFSLVRIVGARKAKDRNLTEYRAVYLV